MKEINKLVYLTVSFFVFIFFGGAVQGDETACTTFTPPLIKGQILEGCLEGTSYRIYFPSTHKKQNLKLLVVIHGTDGNPDDYIRLPLENRDPEKYGLVVLAPHFVPGNDFQKFNTTKKDKALNNIIEKIKASYSRELPENFAKKMFLFGHSRGGHFVHRYAARYPQRVYRAAPSSVNSYLDDNERGGKVRKKFLGLEITNYIGTNDHRAYYNAETELEESDDAGDFGWFQHFSLTRTHYVTNGGVRTVAHETTQHKRVHEKWNRQVETRKFICCRLAQFCNISNKSQFTPNPPDRVLADFDCDYHYNAPKMIPHVDGLGNILNEEKQIVINRQGVLQHGYTTNDVFLEKNNDYCAKPTTPANPMNCGYKIAWHLNGEEQGHQGKLNYPLAAQFLFENLEKKNLMSSLEYYYE